MLLVVVATLLASARAYVYTQPGSMWATLGGCSERWGRWRDDKSRGRKDDLDTNAIRTFDAAFARVGNTGTGLPIIAQPIIAADGTVYVRSGGRLFAYEGTDGGSCPAGAPPALVLKWSLPVDATYSASEPRPERVSTPSLAADGTIIFGSMDAHVYAVHPNGTLRWRLRLGGAIESSPVIGQGLIAIGCNDFNICAEPHAACRPS